MELQTLSAFQGAQKNKEFYVNQVHEWVQNKRIPRSPLEIVNEIFSPRKVFKPSDCILENYELFPEKLGLPLWLSNLLRTINHNNSKEVDGTGKNYELFFYEQFLSACNVGVDYSLMFHKWEIFLLKDMIPQKEKKKIYVKTVIKLHEKSLSGINPDVQEWAEVCSLVEDISNNVDEFTGTTKKMIKEEIDIMENLEVIKGTGDLTYEQKNDELTHLQSVRKAFGQVIWNSGRAAYLSAREAIDVQEFNDSSAEAIVEAIWQEALSTGAMQGRDNEQEMKQKTWFEIIETLLIMIREWE